MGICAVEAVHGKIGRIPVPLLDGQIVTPLGRGEKLALGGQRILVVDSNTILADGQEINLLNLTEQRYPKQGNQFIAIMALPFATFRN